MYVFIFVMLSNNFVVVVYFILLHFSAEARETGEGSPFVARHVV